MTQQLAQQLPPRHPMISFRRILVPLLALVALAACSATPASAQSSRSDVLFAHGSVSGTAKAIPGREGQYRLTLRGVNSRLLSFEDRPGRKERDLSVQHMMNGFFKKPGVKQPNAALSLRSGGQQREIGVELLDGRYDRKQQIARYRVRYLKQKTGKRDRLPRRFGQASLFIDSVFGQTCDVRVDGGMSADGSQLPLKLLSASKYSHDDWGILTPGTSSPIASDGPPAQLSAYYDEYVRWGSMGGFMRGCWNNATYGDQYGQVTISIADPYSGSNQYSCVATGYYSCVGPQPDSVLGGGALSVNYTVCRTVDGCTRQGAG